MNTRSSKEYRYIFTTTWKQASTSHLSSRLHGSSPRAIYTDQATAARRRSPTVINEKSLLSKLDFCSDLLRTVSVRRLLWVTVWKKLENQHLFYLLTVAIWTKEVFYSVIYKNFTAFKNVIPDITSSRYVVIACAKQQVNWYISYQLLLHLQC
jgi:hypothetical protein